MQQQNICKHKCKINIMENIQYKHSSKQLTNTMQCSKLLPNALKILHNSVTQRWYKAYLVLLYQCVELIVQYLVPVCNMLCNYITPAVFDLLLYASCSIYSPTSIDGKYWHMCSSYSLAHILLCTIEIKNLQGYYLFIYKHCIHLIYYKCALQPIMHHFLQWCKSCVLIVYRR